MTPAARTAQEAAEARKSRDKAEAAEAPITAPTIWHKRLAVRRIKTRIECKAFCMEAAERTLAALSDESPVVLAFTLQAVSAAEIFEASLRRAEEMGIAVERVDLMSWTITEYDQKCLAAALKAGAPGAKIRMVIDHIHARNYDDGQQRNRRNYRAGAAFEEEFGSEAVAYCANHAKGFAISGARKGGGRSGIYLCTTANQDKNSRLEHHNFILSEAACDFFHSMIDTIFETRPEAADPKLAGSPVKTQNLVDAITLKSERIERGAERNIAKNGTLIGDDLLSHAVGMIPGFASTPAGWLRWAKKWKVPYVSREPLRFDLVAFLRVAAQGGLASDSGGAAPAEGSRAEADLLRAAKTRHANAQADKIERENAIAAKRLMPVDVVAAREQRAARTLALGLKSLPGRIAAVVCGKCAGAAMEAIAHESANLAINLKREMAFERPEPPPSPAPPRSKPRLVKS